MANLVEETRNIMKKYGIRANKDLGQNFLINNDVVENIVNSSEISQDDMVIEIGPGLGTLTKYLLEKAGKVLCIELDKKMIEILEDRFEEYSNFEIINDDVLKVDLNKIIKENKELYEFVENYFTSFSWYSDEAFPYLSEVIDKIDEEKIRHTVRKIKFRTKTTSFRKKS